MALRDEIDPLLKKGKSSQLWEQTQISTEEYLALMGRPEESLTDAERFLISTIAANNASEYLSAELERLQKKIG